MTQKSRTSLAAAIPAEEKKQLEKAASFFGFSADEFSRRVIAAVTEDILSIPEESLEEYENPEEILQSLRESLRDQRQGKVLRALPHRVKSARA